MTNPREWLYIGTVFAQRDTAIGTAATAAKSVALFATSPEEAHSKAILLATELFPYDNSWKNHAAVVRPLKREAAARIESIYIGLESLNDLIASAKTFR